MLASVSLEPVHMLAYVLGKRDGAHTMKGKHRGIILEYSDGPNVIMAVLTSRDPFIAGGREI